MYKVTIVKGFSCELNFEFSDTDEVKEFMDTCFKRSTEKIKITVETIDDPVE